MQQAPIKPQCNRRSLCWCNLVVQPWDFKGVGKNKVQQKCEFDSSSVQSMVWALACQLTPVAWLFLVVHHLAELAQLGGKLDPEDFHQQWHIHNFYALQVSNNIASIWSTNRITNKRSATKQHTSPWPDQICQTKAPPNKPKHINHTAWHHLSTSGRLCHRCQPSVTQGGPMNSR
jgi:hypothetical protein